MSYSLRAFLDDKIIFESEGKWLYPLFELEEYLRTGGINPADVSLEDKIAGRAAASLTSGMGINKVHIHLISELGLKVFEQNGVECRYDRIVDKIECRTEDLINDEMSVADACMFLRKRAGFSKGLGLRLNRLEAGYGNTPVFRNLSLLLDAGDQLIIRGAHGSGKTTLLKAIAGILQPLSGSVSLVDAKGETVNAAAGSIAFFESADSSIQNPVSAEDIVRMRLPDSVETDAEQAYRIELAMKRTGCFHLQKVSFAELSAGEKLRISLAGCIAQEPGVFLIDEPTSSLDAEAREGFIKILRDLLMLEVPTIIIVSNDNELIKALGWRMLDLSCGNLVETV